MQKRGFTLIEILLAMSVLVIGLVGILALFPVGLNATRKAIEETNAAIIADSVYSSLRASAKKTTPGGRLEFFFDGMDANNNKFPLSASGKTFAEADIAAGYCFGIPNHHYYDGSSTINASNGALVEIAKYRVNDYKDPSTAENASLEIFESDFGQLGQLYVNTTAPYGHTTSSYAINPNTADIDQLRQYSFNIQISRPSGSAPKSLYDVAIRIARGKRLIRTFYSKIMIPTS